jgi:hypothetical protein
MQGICDNRWNMLAGLSWIRERPALVRSVSAPTSRWENRPASTLRGSLTKRFRRAVLARTCLFKLVQKPALHFPSFRGREERQRQFRPRWRENNLLCLTSTTVLPALYGRQREPAL